MVGHKSVRAIMSDLLMLKIIRLPSFGVVWETFAAYSQENDPSHSQKGNIVPYSCF